MPDGGISPSTAFITTADNVTYTFVDNINVPIIAQRNNTVIDGNGYTLQGSIEEDPGCMEPGFYLSNVTNITIRNMIITDFAYGIFLGDSSSNTLSNNYMAKNLKGIYLSSSTDNTLSGNTIVNNMNGVYLYNCSGNVLSDNNLLSNQNKGIYLDSSDNNTLSGNNMDGNQCSIFLSYSSNNTLFRNNATNSQYGIFLHYSSGNRIFHNNLLNNLHSANVEESNNTWDDGYPSGGNYWSDYLTKYPNATEIDGSGIGNTLYTIDPNNIDRYPLTNPTIIPEFPSPAILLLFILMTVATIAFRRRKQ
jgi:parallel beta-helix repeat protein